MDTVDLIPRVTSEMLVAGYVPAPDVEVTAEMIAAGADLVANEMGLVGGGDPAQEVAEMVFRVMMAHAPYRELCSPDARSGEDSRAR